MLYAEHHHVGSQNFTIFLFDSKTIKLYIVDGSCTVMVEILLLLLLLLLLTTPKTRG
jgi:hypothetical protein